MNWYNECMFLLFVFSFSFCLGAEKRKEEENNGGFKFLCPCEFAKLQIIPKLSFVSSVYFKLFLKFTQIELVYFPKFSQWSNIPLM